MYFVCWWFCGFLISLFAVALRNCVGPHSAFICMNAPRSGKWNKYPNREVNGGGHWSEPIYLSGTLWALCALCYLQILFILAKRMSFDEWFECLTRFNVNCWVGRKVWVLIVYIFLQCRLSDKHSLVYWLTFANGN